VVRAFTYIGGGRLIQYIYIYIIEFIVLHLDYRTLVGRASHFIAKTCATRMLHRGLGSMGANVIAVVDIISRELMEKVRSLIIDLFMALSLCPLPCGLPTLFACKSIASRLRKPPQSLPRLPWLHSPSMLHIIENHVR
jgi:hypothetical protein